MHQPCATYRRCGRRGGVRWRTRGTRAPARPRVRAKAVPAGVAGAVPTVTLANGPGPAVAVWDGAHAWPSFPSRPRKDTDASGMVRRWTRPENNAPMSYSSRLACTVTDRDSPSKSFWKESKGTCSVCHPGYPSCMVTWEYPWRCRKYFSPTAAAVGSRAYSATGANRQASTTQRTRRRLTTTSTSASKRHRAGEGTHQNRRRRLPSSPRTRRGVAAVVTVNTSPRPREKRRWGPSTKRRPRRVLEITASSVSGPTIPWRRR